MHTLCRPALLDWNCDEDSYTTCQLVQELRARKVHTRYEGAQAIAY